MSIDTIWLSLLLFTSGFGAGAWIIWIIVSDRAWQMDAMLKWIQEHKVEIEEIKRKGKA